MMQYNYRNYNPLTGCWISRDKRLSIAKNLYQFCKNEPNGYFDILGNEEEIHKGVGLYVPNGDTEGENVNFKKQVSRNGFWAFETRTGKAMLRAMETVTAENKCNCIKTLSIAGHGFGAYNPDTSGGIPGCGNNTGLYSEAPFFADIESATLNDLATSIQSKKIKFCKACLIQLYGCRQRESFAIAFAKVTGCRVVFASGSCGIHDNKIPEDEWRWISGPEENFEASKYIGFKEALPNGEINDLNPLNNEYSSTYMPVR